MAYKKVCKFCGSEFESEARNTRYCSEECCAKAQKKRVSHDRKCTKRRKEYDENKDLMRLINRAYSLSQAIGDMMPKVCACKDEPGHVCEGPMELHHKDGNPFNASPNNLEWRCRRAHEDAHTKMPQFNLVGILKEALLSDNPGEVFTEYFYEKD